MPKKPSKPKKTEPAPLVELKAVTHQPEAKQECLSVLRDLDQNFYLSSEDGKYIGIAYGVYLLKLRQIHLSDTCRDGETGQIIASEDGFHRFLESELCRQDFEDEEEKKRHFKARIRGFQRLMNAARNAGLTGDHTVEDVQRIRALKILDGKTLTDLYRPQPKQIADAGPPPQRDLAGECAVELGRICGEVLALREESSHEVFEANWRLLQATLEAYTGSPWSAVPEGYDAGEHGEVHFAPPKKKRKKAKATKGKAKS